MKYILKHGVQYYIWLRTEVKAYIESQKDGTKSSLFYNSGKQQWSGRSKTIKVIPELEDVLIRGGPSAGLCFLVNRQYHSVSLVRTYSGMDF